MPSACSHKKVGLKLGVAHQDAPLLFSYTCASMIDISQWRAAIGQWNCFKLHITSLTSTESWRALINDGLARKGSGLVTKTKYHFVPIANNADYVNSTISATFDVASAVVVLSVPALEIVCHVVHYYFLLLVLLSGDVEPNPGPPITVEQGSMSNCEY